MTAVRERGAPVRGVPRGATGTAPRVRPPVRDAPVEAPREDRGPDSTAGGAAPRDQRPTLYARVLRLRHTDVARWQAVLLFDVVIVVGVLLALAEVATAWAPVVLPVAVAAAVKGYDLVAGMAGPVARSDVPVGQHRAVARHDRSYVPRHSASRSRWGR